jgi:hypothetical protein
LGYPGTADVYCVYNGFVAMDRWLTAIEKDGSSRSLAEKVVADKPPDLSDRCYDGDGHKVSDTLCPDAVVPVYGTPRTVAGDAITTDTNKCQLKPLSRNDDYGLIPFTDDEWATLQALFPDGVCDFSKPGVDQQGTIPWQTYQDDGAGGSVIYGGRPLGDPPASVEVPSYVRPKGATPFSVPLVPAFEQCASPSSQHGAPLSFGSCAPPRQTSGQLTVGTPDANGKGVSSVGRVLYQVILGDPVTPSNDADVQVGASLTDVRRQDNLDDYTGELSVHQTVKLTDRQNGSGQAEPGTVEPFDFEYAVPCSATASTTEGGRCTLSSSFNALVPGAVIEEKRAIWELGTVEVYDGGPDGLASTTSGNALFERQGVFIP